MWHTGARAGTVRSLNLGDLDTDRPGVQFRHRPEVGTSLKNKEKGKRWDAISPHVSRVLEDYIDGPRNELKDDYGRDPLISTQYGRVSISTIRDTLYRITRPCWRGAECPHDHDVGTCEATDMVKASTWPSFRSPHDVRSGRVTAYRREDVPRASSPTDLTRATQSSTSITTGGTREKSEQRRDYLPGL